MAQQPNVEIPDAERPRTIPEPGVAVKWRADKPGVPQGPDDVPAGGRFGNTGPDPGWGVRIVNQASLPDGDPRLRDVVSGLVMARAARLGRAPMGEDIEVALILCGFWSGAPDYLEERRKRWLEATAHDLRKGATAVGEVDPDLLVEKPDRVRTALRLQVGA